MNHDNWTEYGDLCHRCDVYVGHGAAGVVRPPAGREEAWLRDHCWVCGASRIVVRQANGADV